MSGGHYNYKYYQVEELADDIERDFLNNGKYQGADYDERGKMTHTEYDRIGDATPKQRIKILGEVNKLITDLRYCAFRAKELEWYMSGDYGSKSYLKALKEKNK